MENNPQVIFENCLATARTMRNAKARRRGIPQPAGLCHGSGDIPQEVSSPAGDDRGRLTDYPEDARGNRTPHPEGRKANGCGEADVLDTPAGVPDSFEQQHSKTLSRPSGVGVPERRSLVSSTLMLSRMNSATRTLSGNRASAIRAFNNLSHHSTVRANKDRFAELNASSPTACWRILGETQRHSRRRRQPRSTTLVNPLWGKAG